MWEHGVGVGDLPQYHPQSWRRDLGSEPESGGDQRHDIFFHVPEGFERPRAGTWFNHSEFQAEKEIKLMNKIKMTSKNLNFFYGDAQALHDISSNF